LQKAKVDLQEPLADAGLVEVLFNSKMLSNTVLRSILFIVKKLKVNDWKAKLWIKFII